MKLRCQTQPKVSLLKNSRNVNIGNGFSGNNLVLYWKNLIVTYYRRTSWIQQNWRLKYWNSSGGWSDAEATRVPRPFFINGHRKPSPFHSKNLWKINESIPYVNRFVESFFIEKLEVLMKMDRDSEDLTFRLIMWYNVPKVFIYVQ